MRQRNSYRWALTVALLAGALSAMAQQDDGPILRPRKPTSKPMGAKLLVFCDLACNWKLDGEAKGRIDAGGSVKAMVELGQHIVTAVTEDGADQVSQLIESKTDLQTAVKIELKLVRDSRLRTEEERRGKAEQQAKDRTEQEARDKAAKVERDTSERERQERERKVLEDAARTVPSPKASVPPKSQDEQHRGVWVAGHGSAQFSSVYMELLDFLSTSGVEIANFGPQKLTNTQEAGLIPLSSLIEMLPKAGANSLLYIKVEQGEIMLGGYVRATVYFQCFDITGRLLWDEKVISGAVNGADARMNFIMRPGWRRKLTPHIGKPGLLLRQGQEDGTPEPKK